jgi:uncharacterized protein (TIGR02284 family)
METSNEKVAGVLNDLVAINNDRIEGYERALKELKDEDEDLRPLFLSMIDESRQAKMELGSEIENLKSDIETGTTGSGKIYRSWMAVKSVFTGHTRHAILESCEYGEDAAQKAYQEALEEEGIPAYLVELISEQKEMLRASHNEIKAFRDQVVTA